LRALVIGTAGHVDHGKTALVRALTGIETDRWKEERERGLTIDLGFAPLSLGDGLEVSVVDVPGHEDFVKNMLAGATGIDLLLLVVAADEGPMPQTREHLAIARILGIADGVVALTKRDRVDEGWLDLCRDAVREELEKVLGHSEWPMLAVSSVTGEGVDELRAALTERAAALESLERGDLLRLPVDRSFSVAGAGTVVTGTVWSGTVNVGDEVTVLPGRRSARVRSLQVHSTTRESVGPRRRCAASLVGLDPALAPRGAVVVAGSGWRETRRLGVRLSVLSYSPRRIESGQRVRVYLGTREVLARVRARAGGRGVESVDPGDEAWAILELEEGLVARARDRFVVRFYSPVTTIGGGRVAELDPPVRWLERTRAWERILSEAEDERLEAAVGLSAGRGAAADDLPLSTGLSPEKLRALEGSAGVPIVQAGGRWFSTEVAETARRALLKVVAEFHAARPRAPGVSTEAVRSKLSTAFAPELVAHALEGILGEGLVVATGPELRLSTHRARLTEAEARVQARLLAEIDGGGLEPPMVGELRSRLGVSDELLHDLLRLLARAGDVENVNPEIYLSARSAERLRDAAARVFERRLVAAPTDFKRQFGVTRKYLIPLLEHLDRKQVTRRTEEGRMWRGCS
jgi:selenocysteine-specific elongation factor